MILYAGQAFTGRGGEEYPAGVETDFPPADVGLAFAQGWQQSPPAVPATTAEPDASVVEAITS